jgi:hypothetical protein
MTQYLRNFCPLICLFIVLAGSVPAYSQQDHHVSMKFDRTGMVMNQNHTELPRDCDQVSGEVEFVVHVGSSYAEEFPETVFGMSQHEYNVAPCSLVTITMINEDQVRHQWMLHGLPRYLYPQGMFHLEAAGGESQTGSFIVPSDDRTYLVHCDMTQHMEKGMKGQLVVGAGSGDLWSVPGVSRGFKQPGINNALGISLVFSMGLMSLLVMMFLKQ